MDDYANYPVALDWDTTRSAIVGKSLIRHLMVDKRMTKKKLSNP